MVASPEDPTLDRSVPRIILGLERFVFVPLPAAFHPERLCQDRAFGQSKRQNLKSRLLEIGHQVRTLHGRQFVRSSNSPAVTVSPGVASTFRKNRSHGGCEVVKRELVLLSSTNRIRSIRRRGAPHHCKRRKGEDDRKQRPDTPPQSEVNPMSRPLYVDAARSRRAQASDHHVRLRVSSHPRELGSTTARSEPIRTLSCAGLAENGEVCEKDGVRS